MLAKLACFALASLIGSAAGSAQAMGSTSPTDAVPILVHMVACKGVVIPSGHFTGTITADLPGGTRMPLSIRSTISADRMVTARFAVRPGSYIVHIEMLHAFDWPEFEFTAITGHPRVIFSSICSTALLSDTSRSVSGVLPAPGLEAELLTNYGKEPVVVDGDAFYAILLPPGKLTLRLHFAEEDTRYCDLPVPTPHDDKLWMFEHIRFDVTAAQLQQADTEHRCRW